MLDANPRSCLCADPFTSALFFAHLHGASLWSQSSMDAFLFSSPFCVILASFLTNWGVSQLWLWTRKTTALLSPCPLSYSKRWCYPSRTWAENVIPTLTSSRSILLSEKSWIWWGIWLKLWPLKPDLDLSLTRWWPEYQLPHFGNGDNNKASSIGLLWGLNVIMPSRLFAQSLTYSRCWINVGYFISLFPLKETW